MKGKIISALKTKYSNLGFSAKAIEGVAESLAATGLITDENLDTIIEGQKSVLSAMQAEIDSRVTSAVEKAKTETNKDTTSANGGGQSNSEPEKPFDAEAFKAEMLKMFREEQATTVRQNQQIAQRNALIASKAKELGIPEWRMKEGFVIADDADEKAIGDYLASVQKNLVTAGLEGKGSGFPMSTPEAQGKELAKAWAETLPDKE